MKAALIALVLLPAALAQTAPDPLDGLVADSPFQPGNGVRGPAATATGPLELRSVVFVDGAYQFSIYDQGTREASWVKIGERGQPFVARSYNQERDSLTVEHQGRTLVLGLQPAKMAAGAMVQQTQPAPLPGQGDNQTNRRNNPAGGTANAGPPAPPQSGNATAGGPAPPPGTANQAEAQRLQNLADELRRRRSNGPPLVLPKN